MDACTWSWWVFPYGVLLVKAKKLASMAAGVGSLVPLLPAPATFPIASWSLGPLYAMFALHCSVENVPNLTRVDHRQP